MAPDAKRLRRFDFTHKHEPLQTERQQRLTAVYRWSVSSSALRNSKLETKKSPRPSEGPGAKG